MSSINDRSIRGEGGRLMGSHPLPQAPPALTPKARKAPAHEGAAQAAIEVPTAYTAFAQSHASTVEPIPDFPEPDTRYRLSPSRASDYRNCPLRYRYLTIDRFPEPLSPAPALGTLVHTTLEKVFDAPPGERSPERARAIMAQEWDDMVAARPEYQDLHPEGNKEAWLASASTLLDTYFRMEDPAHAEPARREHKVTYRLDDDVTLLGIVDRIDVAPTTGDVRILDYKTGRSPRLGYEEKALFQLRFYALALKKATGRTPKMLQLMYLGDGRNIRYEPTDADMEATEAEVAGLWSKIHRSLETGDFPARPSGLCASCSFRDKCPEQGGTVPPMPQK